MERAFLVKTIALLTLLTASTSASAQGLLMPGVSPVNLSMGGAAAATPIDAAGGLYFNAATISGMENQMSFSMIDVMPDATVASSITGLGAGSTNSDSGGSVVPSFGLVYRPESSDWTIGIAAISPAGARMNYPVDPTNPIFTPQSNSPTMPGGLGSANSAVMYSEFMVAFSYQVNEKLSVAVAPTGVVSDINFQPLVLSPLSDADGSGQPTYPLANGHATNWGGGFQAGLFYQADNWWNFGFSYKSERWMEDALWNSMDELGRPTKVAWEHEMPAVFSFGTSYNGFENAVFALDMRYVDYKNAKGCGTQGIGPAGNVLGAGQASVWSVSLGVQYDWNEKLTTRCGYTFNESPHDAADATPAIFGPFYWQHTLHFGGSLHLTDNLSLDAGYSIVLPATLHGPIESPAGPVPGSLLSHDYMAHMATVGATAKY